MGFGRKYKDLPTPESVVWRYKIATRACGTLIVMIQGWTFLPEIPVKIASGLLGAFMAISRDLESMYGVHVPPLIKKEDVEVVNDDALKTMIFFLLCGTPFLFN